MRLGPKLVLTSSLIIVVLGAVGALGLRAVGQLVSVNREIATQSLPALRLTAAVRDSMLALGRLEARFLVHGDWRFATLWDERQARALADLAALQGVVRTRDERTHLDEAVGAFEEYRQLVAEGQTLLERGERERALRLAEQAAPAAIDRVASSLDGLSAATYARVQAAQAAAARLETRTWAGALVALGAAVGLALLGTAAIAMRITRSLRTLSAATAAVAAGSFRDPIPVASRDEIGELARSFNAMGRQLREIDATKEEFFATLSHELRSPLTSVREAAQLLGDEVAGPLTPKQARLVEIIRGSSDRLLGLVSRILDLSRLRAGLLPLERQRVDLDRVVSRAVDELRPQVEDVGLALEHERRGRRFAVDGDEERLVQVVVNLVANAVRFTPRGGRVTVRLLAANDEILVEVEDTGMGIPPAALPHIFEPYRQAHGHRGGSGLGLAIVRGVVQAHGGRVTVESREGKGSRFTVALPAAVEPA